MADPCENESQPKAATQPRGRAVVVGFGPVGRCVSDQLRRDDYEVVVIESNLETIERQLLLDRRVVYGSACDAATLKCARIAEADALIITIPDIDAAVRICKEARAMCHSLCIAVRVRHPSGGMLAMQAGANDVIVEEIVTARAMTDQVCDRLRRQ